MSKNRKSAMAENSVRRDAKETATVEQYWHAAGRPKSQKPPKDYKYVDELAHLQFELIKLQEWVRLHGLKVAVIFEGRDAAGKGGVIKRITQSLNPCVCRVVALGTPWTKGRERSQWYFQRYVAELPARGEIVLFDRSWYNRAVSRARDGVLQGGRISGVPSVPVQYSRRCWCARACILSSIGSR